jgi:thiol-disulfide isomerase/thioredoxin
MLKYIKILLLGFFVVTCSVSCAKKIDINKLSDAYATIQGKNLEFSKNRDKWIIINYWATWCAPCRSEIKEINKLIARYPNTVYVIGVALEPLSENLLEKAVIELGFTYPVVNIDLINDWFHVDTEVFPTTYIINPQGKLVKTFVGAVSYSDLESIIS